MAIAQADEAASIHYHLGMAYYAIQNVDLARQELQKSITLAEASYPGINEARETLDSIFNSQMAN
jgi:Tfp pilus assembly protein PilF